MKNEKKVLFVNLPSPELIIPKWSIPNSLLYLKAYVESKGINSNLLDMGNYLEKDYYKIPLDYDYYCISCYTMQHDTLENVSSYIKKHSDSIIIVGGRHVTYLSEKILESMSIDVVVRGEGEETIYEIISGKKYEDILGITYKKSRSIIHNKDRPLIKKLDQLPFPTFDCLNLEDYPANYINTEHSKYRVGVMFSRGCYGNCAFCTSVSFWGRNVRFYSYDWIEKNITYLVSKDILDVHINDDNFLIHKDFEKICYLFKKYNIKYQCLGASLNVTKRKAEILHDTGCYKISLGIESGSNHILKLMNKYANVEMNEKAINILKDAGLYVESFLMIGFPGETREDISATVDFISKSKSDIFSISTFVPFPGTEVWYNPEKFGCTIDKNKSFNEYLHLGKQINIPSIIVNNKELDEYREILHNALKERDIIYTKVHSKNK